MKKLISILAVAGAFAAIVYAAQDTTLDRVEVRDPVRLEAYLEANASDAETRIAALEGSLGTNPVLAVTVGALTTTGDVTIAEGKLADSTVLSADIKDGEIVNADINASAAIVATKLATAVQTSLGKADTAMQPGTASVSAGLTIVSGAYTGVLNIVSTTLTLVVNGATTNVLDADITTP